jgi:putative ABC transport system permease protein
MLRATIKSLLARKLRLVLTALAVVLGVGFTAGTFILTDTALASFDSLFGEAYSNIDVVVQAHQVFNPTQGGGPGGGGGQELNPVPESVLPKVRAVPGVQYAEGSVQSLAQIIDPTTGKVIQSGGAPTIGSSWSPNISAFTIVDGQAPVGPHQVVIDAGTADNHQLSVGQRLRIVTVSGTGEYAISGVVRFGSANSLLGASFAIFDLPTAQRLFQREGKLDFIYVKGDGSITPDQLAAQIAEAPGVLPKGYEAITGTTAASQQQDQVNQGLGFLRTGLLVFGFVALFVGAFIIFNTFNIVVAQRSRELALFRALGASRRQVLTSVLVEAAVVGLVASIVGVAVGVVLAIGLKALVAAIGLKLPPTALVIASRTVIVSLILGTTITLLAAITPARRASRVAPLEALRETATPSAGIKRRVILGTIVTVAGIAVLAAGLFGGVSKAGLVVGLGAALTFVGVAMLSPLIARPISSVLGRPFRSSISGKLGGENANRNPRRTASTAAALMIGLGLVAFVAVFAASLKSSVTAVLDETLRSDLMLTAQQFTPFSPQLAKDLASDPDFATVSALRQGPEAKVQSSTTFPVGIDPATITQVANLTMDSGSITDLSRPNTVVVSKSEAESKDFTVGSTFPMEFATGTQVLTVVGTYEPNALLNDYAVSLDTYDANVAQQLDSVVFLKYAPGVDQAAARAKVEALVARDYPSVQVNNQGETKQEYVKQVDQVFAIVYVLLILSVIISAFGIVNTLGLSIYERIRELGLLRAVGMSKRQVKRMIRVEAVIIAVLGAILGLAIGILFGWALQRALSDVGVDRLAIPFGQLVVMLIVAALIGVLAAIWPARRAAKLNVLEAISYE